MLSLDIETLGLESTAVILSIGLVYYDQTRDLTFQNLLDSSVFVKFNVDEQIKKYGRTTTKSTLDWWRTAPGEQARRDSLYPTEGDLSVLDGLDKLKSWLGKIPSYNKELVWVRGTLDQPAFESLVRASGTENLLPYYNFRDVRTGLECLYPGAERGYVEVDRSRVPDFSEDRVIAHHPVHDCAFDLAMLLGGKQ